MDETSNPIMRIYYTSRPVLFGMCAGNEIFYASLYLLHFTYGPFYIFYVTAILCFPVAIAKLAIALYQVGSVKKNHKVNECLISIRFSRDITPASIWESSMLRNARRPVHSRLNEDHVDSSLLIAKAKVQMLAFQGILNENSLHFRTGQNGCVELFPF